MSLPPTGLILADKPKTLPRAGGSRGITDSPSRLKYKKRKPNQSKKHNQSGQPSPSGTSTSAHSSHGTYVSYLSCPCPLQMGLHDIFKAYFVVFGYQELCGWWTMCLVHQKLDKN
jgi:hypothetical protein